LYHRALPQVYGYLLPRCGSAVLAEDLTAETFMAAVAAAGRDCPPELSVAFEPILPEAKLSRPAPSPGQPGR
jgi:RNA polymerase sigma-70 factor (ECF subfamily)